MLEKHHHVFYNRKVDFDVQMLFMSVHNPDVLAVILKHAEFTKSTIRTAMDKACTLTNCNASLDLLMNHISLNVDTDSADRKAAMLLACATDDTELFDKITELTDADGDELYDYDLMRTVRGILVNSRADNRMPFVAVAITRSSNRVFGRMLGCPELNLAGPFPLMYRPMPLAAKVGNLEAARMLSNHGGQPRLNFHMARQILFGLSKGCKVNVITEDCLEVKMARAVLVKADLTEDDLHDIVHARAGMKQRARLVRILSHATGNEEMEQAVETKCQRNLRSNRRKS